MINKFLDGCCWGSIAAAVATSLLFIAGDVTGSSVLAVICFALLCVISTGAIAYFVRKYYNKHGHMPKYFDDPFAPNEVIGHEIISPNENVCDEDCDFCWSFDVPHYDCPYDEEDEDCI